MENGDRPAPVIFRVDIANDCHYYKRLAFGLVLRLRSVLFRFGFNGGS